MNQLAKQIVDDDGHRTDDESWHYVHIVNGDDAILCTGEFVDDACSSGNGSLYKRKKVARGGITCKRCLEVIKQFKAIRL